MLDRKEKKRIFPYAKVKWFFKMTMGRYNDEPLFLQWENRNKALKYWPHYSLGELSLCFDNSTLICQRFPLFSLQRSFLHMISPLLLEDSWNAEKIPRENWRVTQVVYALIVGPRLLKRPTNASISRITQGLNFLLLTIKLFHLK
jgi:hypothetical protein